MDDFGPREAYRLACDLLGNADDLLADAELLLNAERHPRAFALATIAAEEMGKIHLCLEAMTGHAPLPGSRAYEWVNHREKLNTMSALEAAFLRDDVVTDVRGSLARNEVAEWAAAKMAALYVDVQGDGQVRRPRDSAPEAAAEVLRRGREASALLHRVLDPVTPAVLDAMLHQFQDLDAALDALFDVDDPEGSIVSIRETVAAATSGDVEKLKAVLVEALIRRDASPTPEGGT